MKRIGQNPFAILMVVAFSALVVAAQQQAAPTPTPTKVEGTVTTALNTGAGCMPTFTLKTVEGKEYAIHLGTLKNAAGLVFTPQIGETIAVTGGPCCGMVGQNMIHAGEIARGEVTYTAPAGIAPGMMPGTMMGQALVGQGQPGQGMMMGQRPMGAVPPGQGMMMGPGMTGQMVPGQGQQGPAAMAPGATTCCGATVATAPCPGYPVPQPAAPAAEPETTK